MFEKLEKIIKNSHIFRSYDFVVFRAILPGDLQPLAVSRRES